MRRTSGRNDEELTPIPANPQASQPDPPKIHPGDYPGLGLGGILLAIQFVVCVIQGSGPVGWLAAIGVALALAAAIVLIIPVIQFKRVGGVAKGDIFANTTTVVDTGLYAIVRHPQFTAGWVLSVVFALYSQHLAVIVLGLVVIAAFLVDFRRADVRNIEKFGEVYVEYMRRVPGWNPIAGLWRLGRRHMRLH